MLDVEYAQISDTGKVRDHNEDYLGSVVPETPDQVNGLGYLFAVADGVGGQDLGEVASRTAVETLVAGFRNARSGESHGTLLTRLIQAANTRVFETGMEARPGGASIATTLVACALRYDRVVVAHVGDSRCYLVRGEHATALTRDHTVANEQVGLGLLSASEAAKAANRHVLTRSLGNEMFVHVETREAHVRTGDVLVLCSDGLHGAVSAEELSRVLVHAPDLSRAATDLVALANERDGGDNVSIQLIRIRAIERVGMYRGRPYKLR